MPPSPSSGSLSSLATSLSRRLCFAACLLAGFVCLLGLPGTSHAQGVKQRLITQAIDEAKLTQLRGNTHPLARAEFDRGPAPASLPMQRMLLVLARSAPAEAAIQTLLQEQQDKSSPNYRKWVTPGEFGEQFGASDEDIQTVTSWLQGHGFQVEGVSNGRTIIEFSGTAQNVQEAFHTSIHSYMVNGEQHWANASDPEIPNALASAVIGVDSLNNFPKKAAHHLAGGLSARTIAGGLNTAKPALTNACGTDPQNGSTLYCNTLGPYDFAAIYNVLPLWNATSPIDGTGESIAIIARSNINLQDVSDFRTLFGLPGNAPQVILDGPDPGLVPGDETEADLDVEWSGAVAKGATIELVVSQSTETTDGVDLSAEYAVDNNIAPIISESFGTCELNLGTAGNAFYKNLWEQAAAQGISVFVSSGDQGSAGCDFFQGTAPQPAKEGLQVSGIASTPYNVSVGGTDFNDFFNGLTYWNAASNPTTLQSAKGYIPEITWNDSCTNAIFGQIGFSTNAETNCNNGQLAGTVVTIGAGGGASSCINPTGGSPSTCTGGYAKPPWQTGSGVPADGKRDVPDVSLFASNGFLDNAYAICEADISQPCNANNVLQIGGTSASSPTFAGLLALVDQKTQSRQGNPNFILYKLAAQQSPANCNSSTGPASTCVFNDVTNGTIAMPCATGSPNCTKSSSFDQFGVLSGYNTGTGYDLATGLGSVNATNLVNNWNSVTFTPSTTTLTLNGGSAVNITHGSQINVGVSVSPTSPQPTGDVSLVATQGSNSFGFDTLTLSNGSASGTTNMLPGGTSYTVKAHYEGNATYGGSDSNAVTVTVTPESSKTALRIVAFDPTSGQTTNPNATTFPYGSPYLLRADVTNSSGTDCVAPTSGNATYGCPTGTVALMDNGTALGTSAFGLNSQGYTEDQSVQLTGGTHTLEGNYSGDNSYNASSVTDVVTVTPAATTTNVVPSTTAPQTIGLSFFLTVTTQAQSNGVAPTGTFSVFDGSTKIQTTASVIGQQLSTDTVDIFLEIPITMSGPSGPHSFTVQYSGDQNYGGSTSSPVQIDAVYPTTMTASATPNNVIYGSGTTVTVTATISTGNPASNSSLKPSGTFVFFGYNGPVSETAAADSNGNWTLSGTFTFTPQQNTFMQVNYSGDSNYAGSAGSVSVNVTIPDFTVSAGSTLLAITAGQTGTETLTIMPTTNYTSTVQLSCGTNFNIPGSTCSISPLSVNLSNGAAATATLTITTLAPSSTTSAMTVVRRFRPFLLIPVSRKEWRNLSIFAGLATLWWLLLLPSRKKRTMQAVWGLGVVCVVAFAIGCGGGASASSGGGGGGNNGPYSTTTAMTVSSTKIAFSSSVTFAVTVTAPDPVTGSVFFNSTNCGSWTVPSQNLTNGSAQSQSFPAANPGTCTFAAQYSGDVNNFGSRSGSLNIAVTGATQEAVTGQTSTDTHVVPVNVTIQ